MCEACYRDNYDEYEDAWDEMEPLTVDYPIWTNPEVKEGDYVTPIELLFADDHVEDLGHASVVEQANYVLTGGRRGVIVKGASSGQLRIVTRWRRAFPPLPNVDQSTLAEEMGTSMDDMVLLDPADPFESVLIEMVAMNRKKRADYANSTDAFVNFRRSSSLLGIPGFGAKEAALHNITQKLARLQALREQGRMDDPKNESVADTYLDLAVYAVILLALSKENDE